MTLLSPNQLLQRSLATLLSLCLFWTSSNIADAALLTPELLAMPLPMPQLEFTPPSQYGRLADYFNSGSKDAKLVILIQDLHAHYGVQKNIAGLLEFLSSRLQAGGSRENLGAMSLEPGAPFALAVEGAQGPIDTAKIALAPASKIKEEALDYLMREGELTGMEYFAAMHRMPKLLVGVEDGRYYNAHRELFRTTLSDRTRLVEMLHGIQADIHTLRASIYSPALDAIQKSIDAYDKGQIGTFEFINVLSTHATAKELQEFPELKAFIQNAGAEANDPNHLRQLTAEFLAQAAGQLSPSERATLAALTKKVGTPFYYGYLRDLIYSHQLFGIVPLALARYLEYLHTVETSGLDQVTYEAQELAFRIKVQAAGGSEERNVVQVEHDLALLLKVADLQATNFEVHAFGPRINEFVALCHAILAAHGLKTFDEAAIRALISTSVDYYVMALMRNQPMVDNTLALLAQRVSDEASKRGSKLVVTPSLTCSLAPSHTVAVLVTGGFHTSMLTQLLRAKNISYLVITPTVDKISEKDHALYVKRLAGVHLTKEEIIHAVHGEHFLHPGYDPPETYALLRTYEQAVEYPRGFRRLVVAADRRTSRLLPSWLKRLNGTSNQKPLVDSELRRQVIELAERGRKDQHLAERFLFENKDLSYFWNVITSLPEDVQAQATKVLAPGLLSNLAGFDNEGDIGRAAGIAIESYYEEISNALNDRFNQLKISAVRPSLSLWRWIFDRPLGDKHNSYYRNWYRHWYRSELQNYNAIMDHKDGFPWRTLSLLDRRARNPLGLASVKTHRGIELSDLITTNRSRFFRNQPMNFWEVLPAELERLIVEKHRKTNGIQQIVKIGVFGAAFGQEPISLAIAVQEALTRIGVPSSQVDYEIHVFDRSSPVFEDVKNNRIIFPPSEIEGMVHNDLNSYFSASGEGYVRSAELQSHFHFHDIDLLNPDTWEMGRSEELDFVVVHNVFQYLQPNRTAHPEEFPQIIQRLRIFVMSLMSPNGLISVSSSDSENIDGRVLTAFKGLITIGPRAGARIVKPGLLERQAGEEGRVVNQGGALKRIGRRDATDEDALINLQGRHLEFEAAAEKVEAREIDGIAVKLIGADLPSGVQAYHLPAPDGTLIIVIKRFSSTAIVPEAIYHEIREAHWMSQGFDQHEAHVIASAEQILRFGSPTGLTPYHQAQLQDMTPEQLLELAGETDRDRQWHHDLLRKAGLDLPQVQEYEQSLRAQALFQRTKLLEFSKKVDPVLGFREGNDSKPLPFYGLGATETPYGTAEYYQQVAQANFEFAVLEKLPDGSKLLLARGRKLSQGNLFVVSVDADGKVVSVAVPTLKPQDANGKNYHFRGISDVTLIDHFQGLIQSVSIPLLKPFEAPAGMAFMRNLITPTEIEAFKRTALRNPILRHMLLYLVDHDPRRLVRLTNIFRIGDSEAGGYYEAASHVVVHRAGYYKLEEVYAYEIAPFIHLALLDHDPAVETLLSEHFSQAQHRALFSFLERHKLYHGAILLPLIVNQNTKNLVTATHIKEALARFMGALAEGKVFDPSSGYHLTFGDVRLLLKLGFLSSTYENLINAKIADDVPLPLNFISAVEAQETVDPRITTIEQLQAYFNARDQDVRATVGYIHQLQRHGLISQTVVDEFIAQNMPSMIDALENGENLDGLLTLIMALSLSPIHGAELQHYMGILNSRLKDPAQFEALGKAFGLPVFPVDVMLDAFLLSGQSQTTLSGLFEDLVRHLLSPPSAAPIESLYKVFLYTFTQNGAPSRFYALYNIARLLGREEEALGQLKSGIRDEKPRSFDDFSVAGENTFQNAVEGNDQDRLWEEDSYGPRIYPTQVSAEPRFDDLKINKEVNQFNFQPQTVEIKYPWWFKYPRLVKVVRWVLSRGYSYRIIGVDGKPRRISRANLTFLTARKGTSVLHVHEGIRPDVWYVPGYGVVYHRSERDSIPSQYLEQRRLAPHSYVNTYIKRQIPPVLIDDPLANKEMFRDPKSGVIVVPILNLYQRTGQFGHIGLGQIYDEPVIYIDADLENEDREAVLQHELYEVGQWEAFRTGELALHLGRTLTPGDMRQWIKDNFDEALALAEQWHFEAPSISYLFKRAGVVEIEDFASYFHGERDINLAAGQHNGNNDSPNIISLQSGALTASSNELATLDPQIQQQTIYGDRLRNLVASPQVTSAALDRQALLAHLGPNLENYIRRRLNNKRLKIAISPRGSSLKGYASSKSDVEYDIFVIDGRKEDIPKNIQRQIFKYMNGLIKQAGFEPEYMLTQNILARIFNFSDPVKDYQEVQKFNSITQDIAEATAWQILFAPIVYGDPDIIEARRRAVIQALVQQDDGDKVWDLVRENFLRLVQIDRYPYDKNSFLRQWLEKQGVVSRRGLPVFNRSRAETVGLPGFLAMKQAYPIREEKKDARQPDLPALNSSVRIRVPSSIENALRAELDADKLLTIEVPDVLTTRSLMAALRDNFDRKFNGRYTVIVEGESEARTPDDPLPTNKVLNLVPNISGASIDQSDQPVTPSLQHAHEVSMDVLDKLYWLMRFGVIAPPVIRNEGDGSILTFEEALDWLRAKPGRLISFRFITPADYLFGDMDEDPFLPRDVAIHTAALSLKEIRTIHLTELTSEKWAQPAASSLRLVLNEVGEVSKVLTALKDQEETLSVLKQPTPASLQEEMIERDINFVVLNLGTARTLILQGLKQSADEQLTEALQQPRIALKRYSGERFRSEINELVAYLIQATEMQTKLRTSWDALVIETKNSFNRIPNKQAIRGLTSLITSKLPAPFVVAGNSWHEEILRGKIQAPSMYVIAEPSREYPWFLQLRVNIIYTEAILTHARLMLTDLTSSHQTVLPLVRISDRSYMAVFHHLQPGPYRLEVPDQSRPLGRLITEPDHANSDILPMFLTGRWARGWRYFKAAVRNWNSTKESQPELNPDLVGKLTNEAREIKGINSIEVVAAEPGTFAPPARYEKRNGHARIIVNSFLQENPLDLAEALAHEFAHLDETIESELRPGPSADGRPRSIWSLAYWREERWAISYAERTIQAESHRLAASLAQDVVIMNLAPRPKANEIVGQLLSVLHAQGVLSKEELAAVNHTGETLIGTAA